MPTRLVLRFLCGLLASAIAPACMAPSLEGCHQRMIESLGCCPICDIDCRGAVEGACADDMHEAPIDETELADEATSSAGDESGEGAPPHAPI